MSLKGREKVPKDVKLSIINIVEGSPVRKSYLVEKLGITPVKYFRWAQKYYLDNCLQLYIFLLSRNLQVVLVLSII